MNATANNAQSPLVRYMGFALYTTMFLSGLVGTGYCAGALAFLVRVVFFSGKFCHH